MNFERSTARTVIAALVFLLVGVLMLVLGSKVETGWLSMLVLNVGTFIIASVVMALIFQFWQLRGLLDDLFRHARIAEQIQRAQLSGFGVSFYDNAPWEELFSESNRLDLMVSYAATWRNMHHNRLEQFLAREDAELKVVLPDPDQASILVELGTRFGLAPSEVAGKISEAAQFFQDLGSSAKGVVRIYYFARAPHFTFYRFNNRAVFATYRHQPKRGPILTLVANRGGELYEWIRSEWYGITRDGIDSGITRLSYQSKQSAQAARQP